jgi:hypothetical protein
MSADSYKILKYKAGELPEQYSAMIYSRFLRSLRKDNQYFKLIDRKAYFTIYRAYAQSLIARPQAVIKLAVLTDNVDIVLGFCLIEPNKLHYVHVNEECRQIGIGKSLLSESFDIFTHITNLGMLLWTSKHKTAIFNPFA